jgi:TetR/AcrR family transcriptional regulator, transcriptional repressor for nem operon
MIIIQWMWIKICGGPERRRCVVAEPVVYSSRQQETGMRYEKGHKDSTRRHIIDTASRRFRENGVAAVGIAGIMSDAGLTNGAFYAHFKSKEDLVESVLSSALQRREERLRAAAEGDAGLEAVIREYLAPSHRDRPSGGCPTAALVAEVARHPKAMRDAFTEKVASFVDLIASQIRQGSADERRRRAIALYGTMVGTLQIARAVNDRRLSDEILESGIRAALALAGEEQSAPD